MAGKAGIERFTKAQFEQALPKHKVTGQPLWKYAGLFEGEHVYVMPVEMKGSSANVNIEIRSSVGADGWNADNGQDSIRAFLTWYDGKDWKPLGSKVQRWVTRQKGWEERLQDMLRTLYGWRLLAGDCSKCGCPKKIFKVKAQTSPNLGRVFAKCEQHGEWAWLTDKKDDGSKEAK